MDKDFNDFLDAVGRRDLDLDLTEAEIRALLKEMKAISSTARLAHTIADRPEQVEMYAVLGRELVSVINGRAFEIYVRTGVADVLDSQRSMIFPALTEDLIPIEDLQFLIDCGIKNPKDEITIAVRKLNHGYYSANVIENRPILISDLMQISSERLVRVTEGFLQSAQTDDSASKLNSPSQNPLQPSKKPKKIFNGIGKILSGLVAGTGNVLIGAGAIPATGGAATAGVIASAAFSVGMIMQGVGDLRGE